MNLRETWRQFIILFEVSSTYDIFMRFFIFSSFAIARMHARICTHLQTVYVFWALFSFYLSCESVCAVYRLCIAQSTTPPPPLLLCFRAQSFLISVHYFPSLSCCMFAHLFVEFRYSTLFICITILYIIFSRACPSPSDFELHGIVFLFYLEISNSSFSLVWDKNKQQQQPTPTVSCAV